MKDFLIRIQSYFKSRSAINGVLAKTQLKFMAAVRELDMEREDAAIMQLQADIFQQALTNTFSKKRVNDFFDESDRLREEHDYAKHNSR